MHFSLFNHKHLLTLLPAFGSCLVVFLLFILIPEYSRAGETLTIGRMKIAIWPEYDDPGVLVIYDGRFADSSRFPLKTSFFLPKGAVISDACSLSPKGQHFCQLYETVNRGEFDEVKLYLPFPNFYLSFHSYPDNGKTDNKAFDYHIRTNHKIEKLELDIQQPLRSTVFKIHPASETISKVKDFNHYKYTFSPVASDEHKLFKIAYHKKDRLPSVDIKYSRMSGDKVWGSPYATQRQVKNIIYIVFFSGLAGLMLVIAGYIYFRRKKKSQDG
jgi:hypothetical protein